MGIGSGIYPVDKRHEWPRQTAHVRTVALNHLKKLGLDAIGHAVKVDKRGQRGYRATIYDITDSWREVKSFVDHR